MPVIPTYPGVYVEEIPSGVRTITGVATSITAFIGFALKGPSNEPTRIQSFADYERQFGGLTPDSMMSYAVQQFFLNGGSDALIVRLSNGGARATAKIGELELETIEPGEEGNSYTAIVAAGAAADQFNLTINKAPETAGGQTTQIAAITNSKVGEIKDSLATHQNVVRVKTEPKTVPAPGTQEFKGGSNPGKQAVLSLPGKGKNANNEDVTVNLVLRASSEGAWGNKLQAIVDHETATPKDTQTFNLTIRYVDGDQVTSEKIRNLSIDRTAIRYVAEVLKAESSFVRVDESSIPNQSVNVTPLKPDGSPDQPQLTQNGADGDFPTDDRFYIGDESARTGIYALEKADLFNLLCIPPVSRDIEIGTDTTLATALAYCVKRRALLIVDPPLSWKDTTSAEKGIDQLRSDLGGSRNVPYAAVYFPRLKLADPLKENRTQEFAPCGAIAGLFAATDAARGVWKAPAGIDVSFAGVRDLTYKLTDPENGRLNPKGLNCIRFFPVYGNVIWGARTLAGDDRLASEWKYVPVRRLALFLEESLFRGTQWVVFEPNDEPLWAQIRLNLGAFMNNLFRQGAFQGKTPKEAYFVKCDSETTTQNDINLGIVNIVIGFAPLKPAEFVILKFQQMAGQIVV